MDKSKMTPAQARALDIYLESATIENEYKPLSLNRIAEQLKSEGFEASSSGVGRWKKDFHFEEVLAKQIQLAVIAQSGEKIEEKAVEKATEKTLTALEINNAITDGCYEVMGLFVKQVKNNYANTNVIPRDDIKLITSIAAFTGGREDKMLDRLAGQGGDKINSDDLKDE